MSLAIGVKLLSSFFIAPFKIMVLENMIRAQFQSDWAKETHVNFGLIRAKSSKVNNEVFESQYVIMRIKDYYIIFIYYY